MSGWSACLARSVVLGGLLLATPGHGGVALPYPNVGPPLLLRLEGSLAPTREAVRAYGFTTVSLGFLGGSDERRWLGVSEARTVGGDHPALGKDVLDAVAPFEPELLVTGPDALVLALRDAPDGTIVHLEGLVDRAARTYYLRRVTVGDPAPAR